MTKKEREERRRTNLGQAFMRITARWVAPPRKNTFTLRGMKKLSLP